ncbi:MAG TPA: hypothetical protein VFS49_03810 [Croceibacterium sp.]|nr:hypothetical protein [Croceibacterium sp.]
MKLSKLLLATIGAAVLLGALVGSASARNLSSSSQTLRSQFREVRFNGAFGNITCQVTLEGSLHSRTITKSAGSLIGYITRADLGPCQEGRATILRETLPWHARYARFAGTLPNITSLGITVTGASFRIQEPLAGCLARTTAESPANGNFTRNTATGALTGATIGGSIPTSCGITGSFESSTGTVTVLNSSTAITITLI